MPLRWKNDLLIGPRPLRDIPYLSRELFHWNRSPFLHGPVDCLHRRHIAQPFHAVRPGIMSLTYPGRECVKFEGEFVDDLESLLEPLALDLPEQASLFFERERRIECGPPLLAMYLDKGGGSRAVTGRSLANQAPGMRQTECNTVFDPAETLWIIRPGCGRGVDRQRAC